MLKTHNPTVYHQQNDRNARIQEDQRAHHKKKLNIGPPIWVRKQPHYHAASTKANRRNNVEF